MAQQETTQPMRAARLLTTPEAALKLRTSEQFLETDRCTRRHGIAFVKVGRKVLYRESDLDAYIERNLVGAEAA
jgi:excisionase family DNA binding protein